MASSSSTVFRPSDCVPQDLDIQYTVGLATGVPVTFLSNGNANVTEFGTALLDSATTIAGAQEPPTVLTTSYGNFESAFSTSLAV